MRKTARILGAIVLSVLICGPVFSAGETTGDFLLVNILARETSIGNVYTPLIASAGPATINPAALTGLNRQQAILSHYSSIFDTHYEQIIYAAPINDREYAGAMLMYDSNDNLERTDIDGNPIEKINNFDIIAGGMYCRDFTRDISIGINFKALESTLSTSSTYGIAMNAGFIYNNTERHYVIGAALENVGITTAYGKEKSLLPVIFRGGYALELYNDKESYKSTLFVEEMLPLNENESSDTSVGLEVIYLGFIAFRYGYIFGITEGRVSIGLGLKLDRFTLDYAYKPFFVSDNEHRITLRMEF